MRLVIELKEVSRVPTGDIPVDVSLLDIVEVVLNGHPDDTILCVRGVACLLLQSSSPITTGITVSTLVAVSAPWVSHLDESLAIAECGNTKDNVSVAIDKTISISGSVITAWGSSLNDIIGAVMFDKLSPNSFHV